MAGQNGRLFQTVVIVRLEIDGILVDILQHFHGDLAHAGFRITVGGRGVAVHGAKVAVAVHQHVPHGKVLRQTDQRVVDRSVAVRMVTAQNGADGVRAFAVRLVRGQVVFKHGV